MGFQLLNVLAAEDVTVLSLDAFDSNNISWSVTHRSHITHNCTSSLKSTRNRVRLVPTTCNCVLLVLIVLLVLLVSTTCDCALPIPNATTCYRSPQRPPFLTIAVHGQRLLVWFGMPPPAYCRYSNPTSKGMPSPRLTYICVCTCVRMCVYVCVCVCACVGRSILLARRRASGCSPTHRRQWSPHSRARTQL
jgi:hypothetical protein